MLYLLTVEGVRHIEVLGRTLTFEKTCGHIVDVGFAELCNKVTDSLTLCLLYVLYMPDCFFLFFHRPPANRVYIDQEHHVN